MPGLKSAKGRGSGRETGSVSAAGAAVEPQMETCRSRLRRSETEGEAEEDLSLLDRGVLRTAVMTGLSLLGKKKKQITSYNALYHYLVLIPMHLLHRLLLKPSRVLEEEKL